MPDVLEERLKKELFDIGTLSIKSNGEDVDISEAEKQPVETIDKNSIQVQYKDERVDNYFLEQIRKCSLECNIKNDEADNQKHNQLTPESGIDGLPCFPSKVKEYKEEDEKSIDSSITGSEYSSRALDHLRFLKEIQNFPLGQKDDQCTLKNKEDEYNTESEKTAISCAESVLQTDETYSDSANWSSEEDSSCSSDYLLPEDSFLMKLEIPLTESEKSLIDEFYQKMAEVEAQNDQERKENIHNPNINCTENALKRIKCLVDEYLKRGIRLNSSYNDSTVTNLIFEKMKGVLDDVVAVRPSTHRVGEGCDLTEIMKRRKY
ncbi:hypothetical protein [Candidatus Mesenet endosymbiont of Agriotes lineatus]|uniref:hypothetical protein n=1 Tax=Candidatus Mesenet endosymbiont of Agriotes lineatus TaxID=3077948 RepID=UPI0030D29285